eukprot:scaffold206125_cov66-Attheya_sp.AAC.3
MIRFTIHHLSKVVKPLLVPEHGRTIFGSVLPTRIPRRSIRVPPRRVNHISLLVPCAFMSACCDMFGSTASEGSFARYQFSSAFGTTIDDWILSLVTIAHVCEHANKGQMKYKTAAALLNKRNVMGVGPMGINYFVGCAVIMGVLLPTSFSGNALLSESCSDKIAV